MTRILVVEDEEHKTNDLLARLEKSGIAAQQPDVVTNVRDAVLRVSSNPYDLIILDMALPTLEKKTDDHSSIMAQPNGGIEILRTLSALDRSTSIVIVTQYPELVINGERAKPAQVPAIVRRLYGQNVVGTVIYSYRSPEWENAFDNALRRFR